MLLAACGTVDSQDAAPSGATPSATAEAVASPTITSEKARASSSAPPEARRGVPAESARVRFQPQRLDLPGALSAEVRPARTVGGELQVPEDVAHVGWWDGSAFAGDPFGSTVLAGHIDSAEQGLGIFTELLQLELGDVVTLSAGAQEVGYQVTSTALVDKDVLATDTDTFEQSGRHRLVLITCWGRWRADVHSYESNFVVVAEPITP